MRSAFRRRADTLESGRYILIRLQDGSHETLLECGTSQRCFSTLQFHWKFRNITVCSYIHFSVSISQDIYIYK